MSVQPGVTDGAENSGSPWEDLRAWGSGTEEQQNPTPGSHLHVKNLIFKKEWQHETWPLLPPNWYRSSRACQALSHWPQHPPWGVLPAWKTQTRFKSPQGFCQGLVPTSKACRTISAARASQLCRVRPLHGQARVPFQRHYMPLNCPSQTELS